ncbi:TPA: hypothetical protein I8525_004582 [Aeromonas hydrophila]|nr:hypothetical protein [Aeromonas hydrophila]
MELWEVALSGAVLLVGLKSLRVWLDNRALNAELQRRETNVATVYLNGIGIGSLPISQHRAMLAEARRDPRLYLHQAGNLLYMAGILLGKGIGNVPKLWALWLVASVIFLPTEFANLIQRSLPQLPQLSGEQVVIGLQSLLSTSLIFSYVVLFLEFVMFPQATRYGYRDVFNDAVSFALRKEFEAPAHGKVEVRYWEAAAQDAQA